MILKYDIRSQITLEISNLLGLKSAIDLQGAGWVREGRGRGGRGSPLCRRRPPPASCFLWAGWVGGWVGRRRKGGKGRYWRKRRIGGEGSGGGGRELERGGMKMVVGEGREEGREKLKRKKKHRAKERERKKPRTRKKIKIKGKEEEVEGKEKERTGRKVGYQRMEEIVPVMR